MSKNFIGYTNLDFDSIKDSLKSRLSQDSRMNNFSESSLYAVMSEIFAATTDFTNYYIERRAEESYLDSAKLRSSISLLSRMLGYVIRRPIPATTQITITLKRLPQGANVGDQLQILQYTNFVLGENNFINTKYIYYKITADDINMFGSVPDYFKEFNYYSTVDGELGALYADNEFVNKTFEPITLIQGERVSYNISPFNDQNNKRYQKYIINDKNFSNLYGSEDLGYDVNTGISDLSNNLTSVTINGNHFTIDRKSLTPSYVIAQNNTIDAGKSIYNCVIKTNMDDNIELSFGDDIISSIGAHPGETIEVTYFSTDGAAANKVGIIGRSVDIQTPTLGIFNKSDVNIKLRKNITGGMDIEPIESIKINAPSNYSTMDRCVTAKDYVSFIKTLSYNNKNINNAIAWGEQEESKENGVANIKLFNVVLYTFLVDMYSKSNGMYNGLISDDALTIGTSANDYFNIVVKSDSTTPLKSAALSTNLELEKIYDKLYTRSEISVKNLFISPIIRDFDLVGTIYLTPLSNLNNAITNITNSIYEYFSNNIDFKVSTYKSNIIDVIEQFSEVKYVDISFNAKTKDENKLYTTTDSTSIDVSSDIPSDSSLSNAQWFASKDIGYVFNSSIKDKESSTKREYSLTTQKKPYDIYVTVLGELFPSSYDNNTIMAIAYSLPQNLLVKLEKVDSVTAEYSLVWNDNYYNNGITFLPTERNIVLGLMKATYESIYSFLHNTSVSNTFIENAIAQDCGCSIDSGLGSTLNTNGVDYSKADKTQLQYFLDNDMVTFVNEFRKCFYNDTNDTILDSFGNIKNFSMRNEVARINTSKLVFTYKT